ncbi:MAG: hypothetical protein JOZ92_06035, partial [Candidatus Dormibacteraeota bacterium]|nr:hypothetical protein [Candidatus Dormibacteraeota bacterium]
RLPRRRRSVSRSPVVIDPADIPDDAEGRVEVIAIRAPADVIDPGEMLPQPPPLPSRFALTVMSYDGWPAMGVAAALLAVLFTLGMVLTH